MGAHLERARHLYQIHRFQDALDALRLELSEDAESVDAHALAALCHAALRDRERAESAAREAVRLGPDHWFAHYARAFVLRAAGRIDEGKAAASEAIRLDPELPFLYALRGELEFDADRYDAARADAERGLALDPQCPECLNLHARALAQRGQHDEAEASARAILASDAGDPFGHANLGWIALRRNRPREALPHFAEALRLQPGLEWARLGLIEALKAKNPLYRMMLAYFLWMGRLPPAARWLVVLGIFLGVRVLGKAGEGAAFVKPVFYLLLVFVALTWVAQPVFNLVLLTNRFGRAALKPEERWAAALAGGCLLVAAAGVPIAWLTGEEAWRLTLVFLAILLPVSGTFACPRGWPRTVMLVLDGVLVVAGLAFITMAVAGPGGRTVNGVGMAGAIGTGLVALLSTWLMNVLQALRPER